MREYNRRYFSRISIIFFFAAAMGYLEAAVVVYLRAMYYPDGLTFPLKLPVEMSAIELSREAATIVMLVTVAMLAGKRFWKRFGYFMILFGIWDIFYYIWLKVTLDWPTSLLDTDVLFLIPFPWVGPVLAPVLISLLMIIIGLFLTHRLSRGSGFRPPFLSWALGIAATILILFTFINETQSEVINPKVYNYPVFFVGLILYGVSYLWAVRKSMKLKKI
jgi:hypothetical protein